MTSTEHLSIIHGVSELEDFLLFNNVILTPFFFNLVKELSSSTQYLNMGFKLQESLSSLCYYAV
jgi:hypothetical protein